MSPKAMRYSGRDVVLGRGLRAPLAVSVAVVMTLPLHGFRYADGREVVGSLRGI